MDAVIAKLITVIVNPLIIILMAIAFLIFIWGLFVFIANADDQTKRKEGQLHMIYGIIGLSIMVGAWGILGFVDNIVQDINTTDSESVLDTYKSQL